MHSADLVDTSPLLPFVPSPTHRSKGFVGALFIGVAHPSDGAAPPPPVGAPDRYRHLEARRDVLRRHDV